MKRHFGVCHKCPRASKNACGGIVSPWRRVTPLLGVVLLLQVAFLSASEPPTLDESFPVSDPRNLSAAGNNFDSIETPSHLPDEDFGEEGHSLAGEEEPALEQDLEPDMDGDASPREADGEFGYGSSTDDVSTVVPTREVEEGGKQLMEGNEASPTGDGEVNPVVKPKKKNRRKRRKNKGAAAAAALGDADLGEGGGSGKKKVGGAGGKAAAPRRWSRKYDIAALAIVVIASVILIRKTLLRKRKPSVPEVPKVTPEPTKPETPVVEKPPVSVEPGVEQQPEVTLPGVEPGPVERAPGVVPGVVEPPPKPVSKDPKPTTPAPPKVEKVPSPIPPPAPTVPAVGIPGVEEAVEEEVVEELPVIGATDGELNQIFLNIIGEIDVTKTLPRQRIIKPFTLGDGRQVVIVAEVDSKPEGVPKTGSIFADKNEVRSFLKKDRATLLGALKNLIDGNGGVFEKLYTPTGQIRATKPFRIRIFSVPSITDTTTYLTPYVKEAKPSKFPRWKKTEKPAPAPAPVVTLPGPEISTSLEDLSQIPSGEEESSEGTPPGPVPAPELLVPEVTTPAGPVTPVPQPPVVTPTPAPRGVRKATDKFLSLVGIKKKKKEGEPVSPTVPPPSLEDALPPSLDEGQEETTLPGQEVTPSLTVPAGPSGTSPVLGRKELPGGEAGPSEPPVVEVKQTYPGQTGGPESLPPPYRERPVDAGEGDEGGSDTDIFSEDEGAESSTEGGPGAPLKVPKKSLVGTLKRKFTKKRDDEAHKSTQSLDRKQKKKDKTSDTGSVSSMRSTRSVASMTHAAKKRYGEFKDKVKSLRKSKKDKGGNNSDYDLTAGGQ